MIWPDMRIGNKLAGKLHKPVLHTLQWAKNLLLRIRLSLIRIEKQMAIRSRHDEAREP